MSTFQFQPKLPETDTNIFTVMSRLAEEHKAINLGQGFPDFEVDPILLDLVAKYSREGKNQYSPLAGLPYLLEVLAEKIERSYGMKLHPGSNLCVTAGATQALYTAIMTFVHPGDEVIIFEPAYDCYASQITLSGGVVVPYTMTYPDYSIDWKEVGELVTANTRMIIINTPHNPSGTILEETDLLALEKLVHEKNILVLSDEVYEHLIYDGKQHQSVMRFPALFQQSMAVFSFGKTLHATGWKLGYIAGPSQLIDAFKAVHQWNVFCANSFLQHAIANYLQDSSHYESIPAFFEQKRDAMSRLFSEIPMTPLVAAGTYFQLYHYGAISNLSDVDFARYLTSEIGVATIPLSPFYSRPPADKVVRLCFAKQAETLLAAAVRLEKLNESS